VGRIAGATGIGESLNGSYYELRPLVNLRGGLDNFNGRCSDRDIVQESPAAQQRGDEIMSKAGRLVKLSARISSSISHRRWAVFTLTVTVCLKLAPSRLMRNPV
jgi:hypothetical protein